MRPPEGGDRAYDSGMRRTPYGILDLPIDLSVLYPLYSIDPRAVWKGQLALLLTVGQRQQ